MLSTQGSLAAALPVAFLAKATILLVVALVAAAALRRAPAGARHLVWLGVLVAVLALPALSRWAPLRLEILPERIAALAAPAASAVQLDPTPSCGQRADCAAPQSAATLGGPPRIPVSLQSASGVQPIGLGSNQAAAPRTPQRGFDLSITSILLALWAAGALTLICWLAMGAIAVRRIVRGARVLDGHDWMVPLWEVADRLDLTEAPRILASDRVEMPFACGVARPTIILPASAASWSDDRRRAVLFHELAHVRRRDLIGHTLGRLACAVYWFHPLVWTAARRLRTESERACDDLVLACGTRASDYADHLLEIVTTARRVAAPAVVLPMARRTEFEGRMLSILDPDVRRGGPSRVQSAALVAGLASLALTVAAVAPARSAVDSPRRAATRSEPSSAVARPSGSPRTEQRDLAARSAPVRDAAAPRATAPRDTAPRSSRSTPQSAQPPQPEQRPDNVLQRTFENPVGKTAQKMVEKEPAAVAARADTPLDVRMAGPERVAMLLRVLRSDSDPAVRKAAAWGLNNVRSEAATAGLLEALRRDDDAEVREMAAWALADDDREGMVSTFAAVLEHDPSAEVRETAAWALGQSGRRAGDDLVDVLNDAMRDGDADVRGTAAWALGQVQPKRAPGGLIAALADPNAHVRLTAAWALGQILDAATAPMLSAAFGAEPNDEVRSAELRALAFLGDQSKEVLERALASKDPELRSRATQMLAGHGPGVWPWPWPWPRPRPSP